MNRKKCMSISGPEPAEIIVPSFTPQEDTTSEPKINLLLTDPLREGGDIMLWTCIDLGDGCLEADAYADSLTSWIQIKEVTNGALQFELEIPPLAGEILLDFPEEFLPFTFANFKAIMVRTVI